MTSHEHDLLESTPLPTPHELRRELPLYEAHAAVVARGRSAVRAVLRGEDPRLLVVVGPCSIHDPEAARVYAQALAGLAARHADSLLVCMRAYFEKPRTSVGWKGLLNDPTLDGRCDVALGLRTARALLLTLAELGLPAAGEALDPLAQRYMSELFSWTAIGARTTESQTHRELAASLAMPVGFKNGTDGGVQVAIHAMEAAARSHSFLGVDAHGRAAVLRAPGNRDTHVVLRGGRSGPNHGARAVSEAARALAAAGLVARVMIDLSHGNCERDYRKQVDAAHEVASQLAAGSPHVLGVMLESHLVAGRQELAPERPLVFGQSVTDACIDLTATEHTLGLLADAVRAGRRVRSGAELSASIALGA